MQRHEIKLFVNFADSILSGEKPFEIRKNDRGYQKGDYIGFTSMMRDPDTGELFPAGHEIDDHLFEITFVLSGWGLQNGYVALGIRDLGTIKTDKTGGERS